jgi:release factor glutamine methyltransferase
MQTVAQALAQARALGLDRLDAQLIVAAQLAQSRSWVIAHDDAVLDAAQAIAIEAWLTRRAAGEPLAYLVGEKEFHGLLLQVDANVLVPRPDTEVLVDWAIELLAGMSSPRVVDLGTGSGAIALALKHACPAAAVLATDASPAALAVAQANARRLALDVAFAQGSWWSATAGARFDLVLSNPPYIAGGDPHLAALQHEPTLALTPGGDGLGALRKIVKGAAAQMAPGAWLLLEHGFDQAEAVQRLLAEHGFFDATTRRDLGGQPRCTGAHC